MTGRIFLKLIVGVFCLLLMALITVDYSASEVARDTNIQNLVQQLAEKGRMLAVSVPEPATLGSDQARKMANAAGGRITTPLGIQPWGSYYGKLTDKFGVQWMLDSVA